MAFSTVLYLRDNCAKLSLGNFKNKLRTKYLEDYKLVLHRVGFKEAANIVNAVELQRLGP